MVGPNTRVYVIRDGADGEEEKIDISSLVRSVNVEMSVGDAALCSVEMYYGSFIGSTDVGELVLLEFGVSRWWRWRRKLWHVTGFGSQWKRWTLR